MVPYPEIDLLITVENIGRADSNNFGALNQGPNGGLRVAPTPNHDLVAVVQGTCVKDKA